jgi:hypothetical protein
VTSVNIPFYTTLLLSLQHPDPFFESSGSQIFLTIAASPLADEEVLEKCGMYHVTTV